VNSASSSAADDWRRNNFDLIRLFAALQVVIVHTMSTFKLHGINADFFNLGLRMFPGVPIFFVISGFLISKSYERSGSMRDYYRNRCLRIFPALWVCLVLSIGVILIAGVGVLGSLSSSEWLAWWAAQMSLYQQFGPEFLKPVATGQLNGSLWTIPVELEFYLLLPLIYAAFRLRQRRGDIALLGLLASSMAIHFVCCRPGLSPASPPHTFMVETVAPYLWMFLVGVLSQRHWQSLRGWLAGRAHRWLLGYLLLCVVARWLNVYVGSADISPLFLLPLAGLVLSCAISLPSLSDRLLHHNDISYGTYIYHALVLDLMLIFGVQGDFLSATATVASALALGAASWWCVERPFLHRKRSSLRAALQGLPEASAINAGRAPLEAHACGTGET
jgi:peptidoglycan/LPS O-acetylase OafA/YrhL